MNDEEKKAIEHLKDYLGDLDLAFNGIITTETAKDYKTILNLIEKQQKEIEELKKYKEGYKLLSYSLDNYTSKDKIKAKLEELKDGTYDAKIVLQSLLEKE